MLRQHRLPGSSRQSESLSACSIVFDERESSRGLRFLSSANFLFRLSLLFPSLFQNFSRAINRRNDSFQPFLLSSEIALVDRLSEVRQRFRRIARKPPGHIDLMLVPVPATRCA